MLSDIIPLFFHKDGCTNLLSVLFKVHHYDIITTATLLLLLFILLDCWIPLARLGQILLPFDVSISDGGGRFEVTLRH